VTHRTVSGRPKSRSRKGGRSGTPDHPISSEHLRTALAFAGMSLQGFMAHGPHLHGDDPPLSKLASPTVRAAYEAALGMPRRRRLLVTSSGRPAAVPERIERLRQEMLKTRVAHG
jgi:hypothetical protein